MLRRIPRSPRKIPMKTLISACSLGLVLTLSLAGCDRAKAPQPVAAAPVPLQRIDTQVGAGKEALAGSTVAVHYTGWLHVPAAPQQHGEKFDSSVGRDPFIFRLGGGQVIQGWDQGVQGMKVGGKRTLVIPASMGYGEAGAGPIPPNANLIFDVELLDVQ
jgi:FKBP-type peptidyl-prolyl cis-trans isomerase FkpA